MSFQSISYILFLALTWGVAMLLPRPRWRQIALLVASYLFYATWSSTFALLLFASSVFNYVWGRVLRRRGSASALWTGLLANIGLLASFKYANTLLALLGMTDRFGVLMPVGLSFYTFQAMSYLLDVYRGLDYRPSIVEFFLYMAFWPTILAGPICRVPEMIPQFRRVERPGWEDVSAGARRILSGLFMKLVVADTLVHGITPGEGIGMGFDQLAGGWGGLDVWFLAVGFGFQLFFDFAGYSNIAIGSARLFGIRLRENFDDPYLSRTPSEFWTRWHMSLSSWIRDYLFFPLATLRRDLGWRNLALVISMTVFGMWHGVGPTFVLWGVYHGLLLVAHRQVQQLRRIRFSGVVLPGWLGASLSWGLTFTLMSLGWILFRANSLAQAGIMFRALLSPGTYTTLSLRPNFYILVVLTVVGYFSYVALRELLRRLQAHPIMARLVWLVSPVYYATAILAVIIWSKQASIFVYFQF